jgi:hypothetical protein
MDEFQYTGGPKNLEEAMSAFFVRRAGPARFGILTLALAAVHALQAAAAVPSAAAIPAGAAVPAAAEDLAANCQSSGWDMAREVTLFKSTAENVPAGASESSLPPLELDVLYVLRLRPQTEVKYLQASGKKSLVQAPLGGLAAFSVKTDGQYRITVDAPLWMDVVGPAGTLTPSTYMGWHECRLFRKSVEYTLRGGESYLLQLSEATPELVRIVLGVAKH